MLVLMTMNRRWSWVAGRLVRTAALVLLIAVGEPTLAQVHADWYQGPFRPDPELIAIQARPVWRDHQDGTNALATATAVVYLRDGRLVATDLTSGWQQWSYGSGMVGPMRLVGTSVLVAEVGRITALDASDGKVLWTTEVGLPAVDYMEVDGGTLLVGNGATGFQALRLPAGELTHTFTAPGPAQPVHLGDGLVVLSVFHGEPDTLWFHGFSAASGLELWRGRGWQRLLAVREGRAYFLNQAGPARAAAGAAFSISVVNATTGTRVDHWQYDFGGLLEEWQPAPEVKAVLTDDALLISDSAGHGAYRFPLGGAAEPDAAYDVPGGVLIAGPYLGLLFFESPAHELFAVAVDGGEAYRYLAAGSQVSRLDLMGTRAFVGRTDGSFVAVDLSNARARYMLSTGSLGFGPTLDAGAFVVVQGDSELLVVEAVE